MPLLTQSHVARSRHLHKLVTTAVMSLQCLYGGSVCSAGLSECDQGPRQGHAGSRASVHHHAYFGFCCVPLSWLAHSICNWVSLSLSSSATCASPCVYLQRCPPVGGLLTFRSDMFCAPKPIRLTRYASCSMRTGPMVYKAEDMPYRFATPCHNLPHLAIPYCFAYFLLATDDPNVCRCGAAGRRARACAT